MSGSTRVLYVDDDPDRLVRPATLPDGTDPSVATATTADEAVALIEDGEVDCVVLGGDPADATAAEFLRRAHGADPAVPCVLFLDADLDPTAVAAIEAGPCQYLRREDGDQGEALAEAIDRVIARRRDRRIEEGRERFRTMVEEFTDVVSVLDEEGRFLYQSPSIESVLGYDPEELVGDAMFEYVHPEDRERVTRKFFDLVEDPEDTSLVEYRFRHADGSWRVMESRGTNMLTDPVVGGVVVNTREVTDRRRHDQRMNVLNRTLRHDLRNAMNVVLGNAELLMREYGTDDRAETIRRTAAEMLDLSNKVREVERALDASDRSREMVDLVSILEERVSAVERSNPEVTVEADLPESLWVLANRRLEAAVENVVENAVEHNDGEDPHVRITVEESELAGESAVTLTVADDGPGIPENELAVVTGGDETPLEHTSGLGLWLVKWIVNESAGEVEFGESELGGAAVRITLKRADVGQRIDVV